MKIDNNQLIDMLTSYKVEYKLIQGGIWVKIGASWQDAARYSSIESIKKTLGLKG